jgi:nucleoside-diphosphate-sugar epimerase
MMKEVMMALQNPLFYCFLIKKIRIKVIITGATGMVGEGVLLECLNNSAVEKVLSVSRRPYRLAHP